MEPVVSPPEPRCPVCRFTAFVSGQQLNEVTGVHPTCVALVRRASGSVTHERCRCRLHLTLDADHRVAKTLGVAPGA
jgi:hypothetical protein